MQEETPQRKFNYQWKTNNPKVTDFRQITVISKLVHPLKKWLTPHKFSASSSELRQCLPVQFLGRMQQILWIMCTIPW